jgi:hypothetical protein
MSYSLLGTSCKPHTIACTSNHKFLPLLAPIYKKQYVDMMQYPGNNNYPNNSTQIIPKHDNHHHPEMIKSYYGKIWEDKNNTKTPPEQMNKVCKNC